MEFINLPMSYWHAPGVELTDKVLEIIDDRSKWPVFIHCFHGADRTGLLVAMFRITRQDWHVDQAYREMKKCGFHRFKIRHFKWTLYDYARRHKNGKGAQP